MTTNGHLNTNRQKPKTVYIPYMCDHAYVLGAALEAHHIPTEVLPPSNNETLAIGLDLCQGRECLPCFTCAGDIIHRAHQPNFDPARAVLLMPTTAGPCRFGQYNALQRDILDREGLTQMEIISPSAENSYQGFGDNPLQLRRVAWQGFVAVDLLQKLLHEYRPYELNDGQTDQIYQQCLERIVAAVKTGGGKNLLAGLKWIATQFETLPVDRREARPVIGLVGEIYLRSNVYSNQDIIRQVERAGGEVRAATMIEWIYFTNWYYKTYSRVSGLYVDMFGTILTDMYQRHLEHKLADQVAYLLKYPNESPVNQLIDNIGPYYDPYLATEAVLSMGKAIEFARNGSCGILNIMPFSCMPGIITAGMGPRLRTDLNNIPWLDIIYDAQEGTNINTRLEAFMYQVKQYQRRNAGG